MEWDISLFFITSYNINITEKRENMQRDLLNIGLTKQVYVYFNDDDAEDDFSIN